MADDYDENDNRTPVFLINGFLEAGKTQFLKFTMVQPYFQTEGRTLLIVCEDGEEQYDDKFLQRTRTAGIFFESEKECTKEQLHKLQEEYKPERVLIEWNGTWMQNELELPEEWFLNQQITIVDTSTLDLYLKNMRAFMGPMLRNSELVICNRADGIPEEKLGKYHLSLKAMAPGAEIVYEGKNGEEIRGDFNIDLPYDINADLLKIDKDMFATFYVDAMDRSRRYDGKEVEFTAQIMKPKDAPAGVFIPGRRIMTCCEADIQFCGFLCSYKGADAIRSGDWVKIRAKLKSENRKEYGGEGPVLYAEEVALTSPIKEVATFS